MKLGLTIGVFDCFHHGHSNLLERCKDHCDLLLVGVMNDYWVRVQKGHQRPHDSEQTRLLRIRNNPLVWKAILLDTLDMTPYLQVADVWLLGENQRNMRPFDSPIPQVRIPETPKISTTLILQQGQPSVPV
jgi:glycerol-3-phosphate cytidylyltransferase